MPNRGHWCEANPAYRLTLDVSFHAGRRHLPIVELAAPAETRLGFTTAATLPAPAREASGVSRQVVKEPLVGVAAMQRRERKLVISAVDSNPYSGDRHHPPALSIVAGPGHHRVMGCHAPPATANADNLCPYVQ